MKRKPLGGEAAQGIARGHAEIKTDKEKKKERNPLLFWTINKQFVPLKFTLQSGARPQPGRQGWRGLGRCTARGAEAAPPRSRPPPGVVYGQL